MELKRSVLRIQLDVEAKDALDAFCDRRGMTQISVISRVVKWFVSQDEVVQTGVLATLSPEAQEILARSVLESMAERRSGEARR